MCMHAEANALLEAGAARARGATLYVTVCPCLQCAKLIAQVGVREIVYDGDYARGEGSDARCAEVLAGVGIAVRRATANADVSWG
jgi:dCMP deaminase